MTELEQQSPSVHLWAKKRWGFSGCHFKNNRSITNHGKCQWWQLMEAAKRTRTQSWSAVVTLTILWLPLTDFLRHMFESWSPRCLNFININARRTSNDLKVKIVVFKCKWRHVIESSPRSSLITTHFLVTVYGRIWHCINKTLTLFLSHADNTLIFNQQRMLLKLPKLSLNLNCTWLRPRSFWVNPVLIERVSAMRPKIDCYGNG